MRAIIIPMVLLLNATVWADSSENGVLAGPAIGPAAVLARHFTQSSQADAWSAETIEIEASIPRLAEHGRLRAIRRLLPIGRPEYQVLATDGDRTVRQQVIGRYLTADVEGASLAPASVAITLANYRFQYMGSISDGQTLVYIYGITPRQKRTGLIRGQLWIDTTTALTVRQTGYLVRSPSIFVRRVNLTRDTTLRAGVACVKTTRVEIDTRLVGRAELTITERPYAPDSGEDTGSSSR